MVKLQVRGGDLDLIEYDFSPFKPGENINVSCVSLKKRPESCGKSITLKVPSRIHLSVLDMNRFSPGTPGGGGFGFALQVYHTVEVTASEERVINSNRVSLIAHLIEVFKQATGYAGSFTVVSKGNSEMEHIGLGSTCTTGIAVLLGMNEAVGCPLSRDDLRVLLGWNYIEETKEKNEVVYGFETGVGALTALNGGMNIIGDKLVPIFSCSFAEDKNVFILIPRVHDAEQNAGCDEFSLLMNRARQLDNFDREFKAYSVLMDFIPALKAGNLKKMGEIMWNLEFRGSKRAEIEHHSFLIYQHLNALRKAGVEFAAMSSVGPSICVVTEKSADEMKRIAENHGLEIAIETKVDNTGIVIE